MNKEELIYLDHAAATPLDEHVLGAMTPYFSDSFFNPSSPYAPALKVRKEYDAAKARLASCIGAKADELVMTAGATESINLAIRGVGGHVVTSEIEHEAVLATVRSGEHTLVRSDKFGRVSAEAVRAAIQPTTRLVSIAIANSELGTIQSLGEIAAIVQQERSIRRENGNSDPIYLHTDASQGAGLIDIHVSRLGVDLMTLNAAKLYGPKQVGLLWAERSVRLTPAILGGGQERSLRSGTENVPGVIGFAVALERSVEHRRGEAARLQKLRDGLHYALVTAFPQAVISGHPHHRLASHLHISFPGLDGERLIFRLEGRGVLASTGSACAANKGTRSHVLTAIGMSPEEADGSLRLTLGRLSDEESMRRAAEIIIEEVKEEYKRTAK